MVNLTPSESAQPWTWISSRALHYDYGVVRIGLEGKAMVLKTKEIGYIVSDFSF